jgi:hypothetical protein
VAETIKDLDTAGAAGPKVSLQLMTNVPPTEEGSTEWGWGASLPSNANEVPHVVIAIDCSCIYHSFAT